MTSAEGFTMLRRFFKPRDARRRDTSTEAPQVPPPRKKRWLKRAALYWKGFAGFFLSLVGVLTVVVVLIVLERRLTQHVIAIDPISVPKSYSDGGYTPAVAAQRLHSAIEDIVVHAKSSMKRQNVMNDDTPDFVVPTVGVSISSIAATLLTLAHRHNRETLSGEFFPKARRMWLTLRLEDAVIFDQPVNANDPDTAIRDAARSVLERTQPYYVAAWLWETKPPRREAAVLDEVGSIIDRLPEDDENVFWAYNLRGVVLERQRKNDLAVAAYDTAVQLNPRSPIPHYNRGNVLFDQRARGPRYLVEAVAEYRTSIALDKRYFRGYDGLGNGLAEQAQLNEDALKQQNWTLAKQRSNDLLNQAAASYETSVRLNPVFAESHYNLGLLRHRLGELDRAIVEFGLAAKFDPRDPDAHSDAGNVWREKGDLEHAIIEYRTAIRLAPKDAKHKSKDPEDPKFAYDLGLAFRDQGKFDAAITAFEKALGADRSDLDTNYYLAESFAAEVTSAAAPNVARRRLGRACSYLNAVVQTDRAYVARLLRDDINAKFGRAGGRCAAKPHRH
jgi:tetratricopeptide (TPR) repeat protein